MLPKSDSVSSNPATTNSATGFTSGQSGSDGDLRSAPDSAVNAVVVSKNPLKNPLPVSNTAASADMNHNAPVLRVRRATGPQPAEKINTEPQMLAEGVFIGEGKARSGEKVFLRMERVTTANQPLWEKYCASTAQLTLSGRSALTFAMRSTKITTDDDGKVRYVNQQYDELADRLGQSKEEFDDFINLLGKNGFAWSPENRGRIQSIHNTHAGATHLLLSTEVQCFVIYASKTADFRIPQLSGIVPPSRPLTYKEYVNLYSDLLLCVGVDFPDLPWAHSKGMFRNPHSSIEKTYKYLSMVLRGFSGAVLQKYFPEKATLHCKPLSSMQYMISSSLQADDYTVEGHTHEEALSTATESIQDRDIFEMPRNYIKVSALNRLYRNHAST